MLIVVFESWRLLLRWVGGGRGALVNGREKCGVPQPELLLERDGEEVEEVDDFLVGQVDEEVALGIEVETIAGPHSDGHYGAACPEDGGCGGIAIGIGDRGFRGPCDGAVFLWDGFEDAFFSQGIGLDLGLDEESVVIGVGDEADVVDVEAFQKIVEKESGESRGLERWMRAFTLVGEMSGRGCGTAGGFGDGPCLGRGASGCASGEKQAKAG